MRAAVLTRPGTIVLEDRPEPRPDPDEVLVRVRAVGVCGSDVHYFEHGRIGSYVLEQPLVLGHEAAGVVEAVSRNVPPGRVGERVSIKPGRPDFTCPRCVADRNSLRERTSFHTTPLWTGPLLRSSSCTWPSRHCARRGQRHRSRAVRAAPGRPLGVLVLERSGVGRRRRARHRRRPRGDRRTTGRPGIGGHRCDRLGRQRRPADCCGRARSDPNRRPVEGGCRRTRWAAAATRSA